MNISTFARPWHKSITVGADKVKSEVDCGQIAVTLEGASIEGLADQLTCDEYVEHKRSEDVLLALVSLVGIDKVEIQLAAIKEEL
jgi:hypothetical protein